MKRPYGRPADWWSLGCLLHELIAGYSPYERGSPIQTWESAYRVVLHTDLELNEHVFSPERKGPGDAGGGDVAPMFLPLGLWLGSGEM